VQDTGGKTIIPGGGERLGSVTPFGRGRGEKGQVNPRHAQKHAREGDRGTVEASQEPM